MLGLRSWFVLALIMAALVGHARADTPKSEGAVALLPLDAEARLTIYGQPVASELARALVAGGLEVVVVGPKMAMPERAKLVVDGTISSNKAEIVFALRVRNPVDGTTLGTTQATAPGLANIDKAATELSAKLLVLVRQELAKLDHPPDIHTPPPDVHVTVAAPEVLHPLLLALTARGTASTPLRLALDAAISPWARTHHLEAKPSTILGQKITPAAVKQEGAELGMSFEVLSYAVAGTKIPYARGRVRVIVSDRMGVVFDRVVVTDSVLGDKGLAPDQLAARTAREVLDILRPHLKRTVVSWR